RVLFRSLRPLVPQGGGRTDAARAASAPSKTVTYQCDDAWMRRLAYVFLCSNHAEGVVWLSVPVPEPRVARFEKMAFGMFVHWGIYSLLERVEWMLHHSRMPEAEYRKLTERFTAEDIDVRALARLAKRAGMM